MAYKYTTYVYDPLTSSWTNPIATDGAGVNYDNIENQPIKNLHGSSEESFINIAGLDYGHYALSGYHKFDSNDDIQLATHDIDILVMEDEVTSDTIAIYPTVENGIYVTNVVTYKNGVVYSHDKQAPGKMYWSEI